MRDDEFWSLEDEVRRLRNRVASLERELETVKLSVEAELTKIYSKLAKRT